MAKLLIIDDDKDIRGVIKELAEATAFDCQEASDAVEALALISESLPALIFLDIPMPEMDGIRFVDKLLNAVKNSCPPIIILSGYTNTLPPILHPRITKVISKPFTANQITTTLEQFKVTLEKATPEKTANA